MDVSGVISRTVDIINSGEAKKRRCSSLLVPLKTKEFPFLAEKNLSFPVNGWVPDCKIGGVDSGFVAKRLASIDLTLIRAMGVVFAYSNGILSSAKYFPGFFRFPEPFLNGASLEEDEAEQSKSLLRLKEEISASKKIIEGHSPKYCFIDGSIVPQFQDKPRHDSQLSGKYNGIISEFESLYSLAEEKNCTLISTVEDSRGSRFRQILQEEVLPSLNEKVLAAGELDGIFDSSLLDYFLELGERSCAFTYTKNISQHPVLHDFSKEWGDSIFGFYLKPSLFDRPLRVEFICRDKSKIKEKADEVASVVFALSSMHKEYAYPSVLIEADLRAKLRPDEIDLVYNRILDKLGNSVKLRMRRDNRPF